MKTSRILKLMGAVLLALGFSAQVEANDPGTIGSAKSVITLTVDKPVIEYMARAAAEAVDVQDVWRMKTMAMQIDHLTISFRDASAPDYVLKFKPLDEQSFVTWLKNGSYLKSSVAAESSLMPNLTANYKSGGGLIFKTAKKGINLSIDKPIMDYLMRLNNDKMDAGQIVRLKKMCDQIDHVTISFCDRGACNYVLKFRELGNEELEQWMFNEGIIATPEADAEPVDMQFDAMLMKFLSR